MTLINIKGLEAYYGDMQALFGLDMELRAGETFALVGANGAGKSTLLRAMCGMVEKTNGSIDYEGHDLTQLPAEEIAKLGIAMVPEGRRLFPSLNVEENLKMGAMNRRQGPWTLERVFALFPILQERRAQMVNTLSGGQQQMVAVGRALMANPKVLLCDELSLGLAPVIVEQIYKSFAEIRREGMAIVIVEQDIQRAISVSDRLNCLLHGQVTLHIDDVTNVNMEQLTAAYFGE